MFKLFKNLKPMSILLIIVIVLVAGQAVAELYLPEKMSEIIDDGIYLDYEPLYKHEEMDKPSGISGVDSEKTLKGYDSDKIPVFEMIDGFSTYDLAEALQEADPDAIVDITFQDIPVKDSKELFDDVITPFLDGLKPYQSPGADFYDFSEADQRKIASIINALIVFDYDNPNNPDSIAIDADSGITVNSLLDQDPDAEDEDAMSNETNRKILTACISRMKHSEYGNLMPVPIDKDGNRIATDEYGHAVDQSKLILMYSDDDGNEVASVKQSATGRPDVMPDYEVIICNNVLGYAYKYEGEKWIDHQLGWTDEKAQEEANVYNADILIQELLADKDFDAETLSVLKSKIVAIAQNYQDDLIMLERLMGASGSSEKRIARLIDKFYTGAIDTGWNRFWIKLGNYLTLSPTGTAKANNEVLELRTAKDMMLPDGKTIQTKNLAFILERGGYMLLLTVLACACAIVAAGLSAKIAANFSAIIRSQVFGKVETFSLIEFDKFSTASLITRSTNDINQIQTVFLLVLRTALIAPVTVIAGFIMSAAKSVPMTLTILYPFPILIVASVVAAKVVFPLFVVIQQKVDHLTLVAREGLTGIRVVRAFLFFQSFGTLRQLLGREVGMLYLGGLGSHVRQDEEILVADGLGQHVVTLVGHVHGMKLLVDHEEQRVGDHGHLPLVVLHVEVLGLLHQLLHSRLGEAFDQRGVFRQSLVGTVEQHGALVLVTFGDLRPRVVERLVHERPRGLVKLLDIGAELHVLGLFGGVVLHRAGNDQRGARIVDQHRVDLVDNRVMMLALHQIFLADSHVVPKVVETEFVVGSEGDVAFIGPAAGGGIGIVLVDAVHGQAVEHVERPHPLGVTLGEVVVDRHHVHSLAGKRIQEHGKSRHEGLSLTGGHLGDLALMQGDASDQLHVIMDHVPMYLVASGHPVIVVYGLVAVDLHEIVVDGEGAVEVVRLDHDGLVLLEAAGRRLDYRERFGKYLIEACLDGLVLVLHELVGLSGELHLLIHGDVLVKFGAYLRYALLEGCLDIPEFLLQRGRTGSELIGRQGVNFRIYGKNPVENGLHGLVVALGLRTENLAYDCC